MERYIRNEKMLSPEENRSLRKRRVVVVGCGGLGGYIIEMLARLGVGHITAIDGDVFEESNLNRQLLSNPGNMGAPKAAEAKRRVELINPDVEVQAKQVFLNEENALALLKGYDVICDALDNISSRKIVEDAAEKVNTPMVFGAIAGWYAQVCTILPGDRMLKKLYAEDINKGAETLLGNPSFTPALAASFQVAETLKVLLKKNNILQNKLLLIDTLHHDYQVLDF